MQDQQDRIIGLLLNRRHKTETESDRKLESFLDRLLMRIYSSTSLTVYLYDAAVVDDAIELSFNEIPDEVVPKIVAIIGVPNVESFTFRGKNHHLFTGFRVKPDKKYLDEL